MSTTITTAKGSEFTLTNTGHDIIAQVGDIKFGVERTEDGFKSRFLVPGLGNKSVRVVLDAENLAKSNAAFDELHAQIRERADDAADRAAWDARVLRGMNA